MPNEMRQRGARTDCDLVVVDGDLLKSITGNMDDNAADPFVTDEQVAAAAQDVVRHLALATGLYDLLQFVAGPRCHEVLSRSPQFHIRVGRQRLVAACDFAEVVE